MNEPVQLNFQSEFSGPQNAVDGALLRQMEADRTEAAEENAPEPTMGGYELHKRQIMENGPLGHILRGEQERKSTFDADLGFIDTLIPEKVDGDLQRLGQDPSPERRLFLYGAPNEAEYYRRIERLAEEDAIMRETEAHGVMGTISNVASYITDPLVLATFGVGNIGIAGGLAARMATGAAVNFGIEGMIQGAIHYSDEYQPPSETFIALGAAAVLGGAGHGLFGRGAHADKLARERIAKLQQDLVNHPGVALDAGAAANRAASPQNPALSGHVDTLEDLRDPAVPLVEPYNPTFLGFHLRKTDAIGNAYNRGNDNVAYKRLVSRIYGNRMNKDTSEVVELGNMQHAEMNRVRGDTDMVHAVRPSFFKWLNNKYDQGFFKRKLGATFKWGDHTQRYNEFMDDVGRVLQREDIAEERWINEVYRLRREADAAGQEFIEPPRPSVRHDGVDAEVLEAAENMRGWYAKQNEGLIADGARAAPTEGVIPRKSYLPRVFSRERAARLFDNIATDPRATIKTLIGSAIKAGRNNAGLQVSDDITEAVANRIADHLVGPTAGRAAPRFLNKALSKEDFDAVVDQLRPGIPDDEMDDVLSILEQFLQRDADSAVSAPRLQSRLAMDLDTSTTVRMKNGQDEVISLRDFYETNAHELSFSYNRWASGERAFAKAGTSEEKLRELLDEARVEAQFNKERGYKDGTKFTEEQVEELEWGIARTMGRSVNTGRNPTAVQVARIANNASFTAWMGLSGSNAITEAATVVAYGHVSDLLKSIPAVRTLMKQIGALPKSDNLVHELAHLDSGLSNSMDLAFFGHQIDEETLARTLSPNAPVMQRMLQGADNLFEGIKYAASHAYGLGHITDYTRQMANLRGLNVLHSTFVRNKRMPKWMGPRLKSWGIHDEEVAQMANFLRDNATHNRLAGIEEVNWGAMDAATKASFEKFFWNYTGEVIQHVSDGSLARIFEGPLMRVLAQFRSFTITATTKHTMKDFHYGKDGGSMGMQKFVFTSAMGSLMYAARSNLLYRGTDKYEERMTWKNIVTGGMNYGVNVSLLPAMADTLAVATGFEAPFAQGRSSGLANAVVSGSWDETGAGRLLKDAGTVGAYVRDGAGRRNPTKGEVRSMFGALMLGTFWGTAPLKERAAEHFGTGKKDKPKNLLEELGLQDE